MVDVDKHMRCMVYMSSYKCHKGEYCNKIHRFPKEDGVVCRDNKYTKCLRSTTDCWFSHTGKRVKTSVPHDYDAPCLVQPMGHLMASLKRKLTNDSDTYKIGTEKRARSIK